jgi:hypothetical protein
MELSSEAVELHLFIENDGDLYRQMTVPIYKNLQKKKDKGTYNSIGAVKSFSKLATEGAKKYAKEFGGNWNTMFSTKDRLEVARQFEKDFSAEYSSGNR